MSSPLDHPGWAGVGAWCQAGQPDKWPLSTARMFHSTRPATLPCPRSTLREYSENVTISLGNVTISLGVQKTSIYTSLEILETDWYLTNETCFIWGDTRCCWWCGLTFPRCASWQWTEGRAPPRGPPWCQQRPGTITSCQQRESVITDHHLGR